jgi:hypothetical protein
VIAAGRDFERMQDYIVGRLSDDERRAFEDRLVREPALVRELEESLRIREGLQRLRAQGYFARAASSGRGLRLWLPALVAAAVAGIALFLWVHREVAALPVLMASPESRGGSAVASSVTAHFTFVSVRGKATPDLDLPSAGLIEIRAAPVRRRTDSPYRVTLIRRTSAGSDEPVGNLAATTLSSDGYVHCFADASRLSVGSYLLRIEPASTNTSDVAVFAFNLRAAGNRRSQ